VSAQNASTLKTDLHGVLSRPRRARSSTASVSSAGVAELVASGCAFEERRSSLVRSGVVRASRRQRGEDRTQARRRTRRAEPNLMRDDDARREAVEARVVGDHRGDVSRLVVNLRFVHSPGTITTGETLPSSQVTGLVTSGSLASPCARRPRDRRQRRSRRGSCPIPSRARRSMRSWSVEVHSRPAAPPLTMRR
jgi:hypothetical protein